MASSTEEARNSSDPEPEVKLPQRKKENVEARAVLIFATIILALAYSYSVFFVPQQRPDEPLIVTIMGTKGEAGILDTILDTAFTEDYDYSSLWDKLVSFEDVTRSSDYSTTAEQEIIRLEFETADEIKAYLQNQSMPNVVTGFTMYFLDQYVNLSVSDPDRLAKLPQGKIFGGHDPVVSYDVSSELGLGPIDGLQIFKDSGRSTIFSIEIDAGEIISNKLTGYPDNPRFKVVHWKAPKR
jgi:hypothetical protein